MQATWVCCDLGRGCVWVENEWHVQVETSGASSGRQCLHGMSKSQRTRSGGVMRFALLRRIEETLANGTCGVQMQRWVLRLRLE